MDVTEVKDGEEFAEATSEGTQPEPSQEPAEKTLSGKPLRDAGGDNPREEREAELTEAGAVKAIAEVQPGNAARVVAQNPNAAAKAMNWLLSSEPSAGETETKVLRINIGTDDEPDHIEWKIQSVDMKTLRRIRQNAQNTRQARKTGMVDETLISLGVVAAGTIQPNLKEAVQIANQAGANLDDEVALLRLRFKRKPGFIPQISSEIMKLSGFDDEDVSEGEAIEAAGN